MASKLTPSILIHVGEVLSDEIFARGLTQIELAKKSGLSKTIVNEIIKGKRPINAKYAIKLEKALGIDAEYWLTAQMNYELDKIRLREKRRKQLNKRKHGN